MKNLKKAISFMMVFCILVSSFTIAMAEEPYDIKVKLDGKYISFDVAPQLIGGRTMVPLRAIFEALGATVEWDDVTKTVTSYNEFYLVKCSIGKNEMYVNNEVRIMDIAPMVVDGRTLVPARFVAEAFACSVEWNAENKVVNITSSETDYEKIEKATDYSSSKSASSASTIEEPKDALRIKGTLNNPYSAEDGATVIYQKWSHYPQKEISIKCVNVIRGAVANNLAHSENSFNDEPNSSQEWCFLEFDVKYISSSNGGEEVLEGSDVIYKDTFFDTNGSKINVADMATLGDKYRGYGVFDTEFYPGGGGKVVIGLLMNKNVEDILLRIPNDSEGTNTWIKCTDGNSTSKSTITSDYSSKDKSVNNSFDESSFYPGTTIPTYTSVTGVSLQSKNILSDGGYVYRYIYTDANDVGDYWKELGNNGWRQYEGDDKTTTNTFESTYVKGSHYIIIYVCFDLNEVWITC